MQVSRSIQIAASPSRIWELITDIDNCAERISGILKVEVLEQPTGPSIVGLKWKEWRKFAGMEATEIMWITEAEPESHYVARAESHGAIYMSRMAIQPTEDGCELSMTFEGTPVTFGSKVAWALTGWMAKKSTVKALDTDLQDIKAGAEAA